MPTYTMLPRPTLPCIRAASAEPCAPPSLIENVPPVSPAGGAIVDPALSAYVYQYPPRPADGRIWLLPSSPSSTRPPGHDASSAASSAAGARAWLPGAVG